MNYFRLAGVQIIQIAICAILVLVLTFSWLFYNNSAQYRLLLTRTTASHKVLDSYIHLSGHVSSILKTIAIHSYKFRLEDDAGVEQNEILKSASFNDDLEMLLLSIAQVRKTIVSESPLLSATDQPSTTLQIDVLNKVANQAEQYLLGFDFFNNYEIELFYDLIQGPLQNEIDSAMDTEQQRMILIQNDINALSGPIFDWLPKIVLMFVFAFLIGIGFFSQHLNSSLKSLEFTRQSLRQSYHLPRIGPLAERPCDLVARDLNPTTSDVISHREDQENRCSSLVKTVIEKTRALQLANDQLVKFKRARQQFLADISHELRTPLTIIGGESEVVLRNKQSSVADYSKSLKRIVEQVEHTNRLIDDLLLVSMIETDSSQFMLDQIVLVDLINDVLDNFESSIRKKDLTVNLKTLENNLIIEGDRERLSQVFAIVIKNALQHCSQAGHIEITLRQINDYIIATVRDDGIGLSEERASQAFERFYQGSSSEQYKISTGLGLPVAKAIVTAHFGKINLKNNVEGGAEITIRLPVKIQNTSTV